MKGISLTTGLEIEIEPFIIDLDTPCSTAPSSPAVESDEPDRWFDSNSEKESEFTSSSSSSLCSVIERSKFDFLSGTDEESLLDFLLSPKVVPLSLLETLVRDTSPACRAAILYYLPLSPITQGDISALIPSLLDDVEIMISLATNIGYYYACGFISETELEYLLVQILTCADSKGKVYQNLDGRVLDVYHLTQQQIENYRVMIIPYHKLKQEANHQKMLKKNVIARHKNWRRNRTAIRSKMPLKAFEEVDIPLPYGCTTLADKFTDVNEMYDPYAPPSVDWAETRPSPYNTFGMGCHRDPVRVYLPGKDVDKREVKIGELFGEERASEGESYAETRASFESLLHCAETQSDEITVKPPRHKRGFVQKCEL